MLNYLYSGHSLRATAATRLHQANIPVNQIKETTGHKSDAGLAEYQRTSEEEQRQVSNILALNEEPAPESNERSEETNAVENPKRPKLDLCSTSGKNVSFTININWLFET